MNVPLQFCRIEKCSSPIGDGNLCGKSFVEFREKIEKCSSPIGDGNITNSTPIVPPVIIEKCSSPIGDGNDRVENCM